MNDKRLIWIHFYPRDWLSDMDLRRCSIGARGLWADMICLMTQGERFGYLTDAAGVKPSVKQLADDARLSETDCAELLSELKSRRVFSETEDGVIFCRRMVREMQKRETNRANGSKGGNPSLKNPEIRDQRLETRDRLTDSVKLSVIRLIEKHQSNDATLSKVWEEWVECRIKMKASKNWLGMFSKQVEMLCQHNQETACEILNQSMRNGWQGLFEPKASGSNFKPQNTNLVTYRGRTFDKSKPEDRHALAVAELKGGKA